MMTDPIADMLTRIRNAGQASHKWVDMPVSKQKIEIAKLLEQSHFVHAHKVLEDGRFGVLRVYLRDPSDRDVVAHALQELLGDIQSNVVFVQADICRSELMVEIDGTRIV